MGNSRVRGGRSIPTLLIFGKVYKLSPIEPRQGEKKNTSFKREKKRRGKKKR